MQWLQSGSTVHERKVYNVIRFIADVGGVLEVFMVVFAVFIYPISYFHFIYKATNTLLEEEEEEQRKSLRGK